MYHLDELDIRILRELGSPGSPQWSVRESFSNISKKLGVDEETVRMRVKRARVRGFLPTWRMMVNPHLMGCQSAGLDLEARDEERKAEIISQIRLVEGVTQIVDFRGKGLLVSLYSENDESLERKTSLIRSICDSPRFSVWKSVFPRSDVQMRRIDWEIVEAMREDARRDLEDVARSLGVSVRTVQRRLTLMTGGRAVYLVGAPKPESIGGLMCNFLIYCPDPHNKTAADKIIQSKFSRIGASDTSPDNYSTFGMSCENPSEADKVADSMKAIDGVESVRVGVMRELIIIQDWLSGEIHKRLRKE